jgi:hypothetical protein
MKRTPKTSCLKIDNNEMCELFKNSKDMLD